MLSGGEQECVCGVSAYISTHSMPFYFLSLAIHIWVLPTHSINIHMALISFVNKMHARIEFPKMAATKMSLGSLLVFILFLLLFFMSDLRSMKLKYIPISTVSLVLFLNQCV